MARNKRRLGIDGVEDNGHYSLDAWMGEEVGTCMYVQSI